MDSFDDEPGTGGGYERAVEVPLRVSDGIDRRIIMRFRGRPLERVSIVLEEIRAGIRGALIRYDDAHGRFHRHAPGWPEPGPIAEQLEGVPMRSRAAYAEVEIRARYTLWEAELFGQEGGEPT